MSDWFSRDETPRTTIKIIKRPNPRNVENATKIGELEDRVKRYFPPALFVVATAKLEHRLEAERAQLKALKEPPPALEPLLDPSGEPLSPSKLDPSLLDAEDANILSILATSSSKDLISKAQTQLTSIQASIEFQVDQFADGVHKLEQACQTMEGVANKVLALSAIRLDEREKEEKGRVGTKELPIQEVLRTLSRIIPGGSSEG
jgi:kinetochore protein Mis13/DSN1